jgi:hypothetical protein
MYCNTTNTVDFSQVGRSLAFGVEMSPETTYLPRTLEVRRAQANAQVADINNQQSALNQQKAMLNQQTDAFAADQSMDMQTRAIKQMQLTDQTNLLNQQQAFLDSKKALIDQQFTALDAEQAPLDAQKQ